MDDSIDDRALDSVSVAPGGEQAEEGNRPRPPEQDAGQDSEITEELARNPDDVDAQLDESLDESMDASDPPSNTQPGRDGPAESSGFRDEDR